MNSAIEWANGLAGHWARGMWPVLWQTAALAAIVGLIVLCNRRMSPALRFWLWMLVPLRLLVMPLIVITLPVLANPPAAQPEPAVAPPPIVLQAPVEAPAPDLAAQPPSTPAQSHVRASIWTWLMAAWIAGIGFFSLRLARGWLRMKAIAGQARENSDARVRDCAREAAAMLGLRKIPRIMTAAEGVSPFVLGMVHPVVVLPAALAGHVSPEELRTVLAHEFAHVRRRDALVGWVLACSDVIYFFNPVVHLVKRVIIFERERACDEQVLALAQAPRAVYARALLSATGLTRPAAARLSCAPVLLESGQHLERRLKSIAEERRPCATLSRKAKLVLLAIALLALPGVTLTARSATAPAVIEIKDINEKVAQLNLEKATGADVIAIFGEPASYLWGDKTFTKDKLPDFYIMFYSRAFSVFMRFGQIEELRFEDRSDYAFHGALRVGSTLDDALKVIGPPDRTVEGGVIAFEDGVLYKNAEIGENGEKGVSYYARRGLGIRIFAAKNNVVSAVYLTRNEAVGEIKDLNAKVAQLNLEKATRADVIALFGEPVSYLWGNEKFTQDMLPDFYIMFYSRAFSVFMRFGQIEELRSEERGDLAFHGTLRVGSTLDDALKVIGPPDRTVEGGKIAFEDGVLYKNAQIRENGEKGVSYYARRGLGVRIFAFHNVVSALYLTRRGNPSVVPANPAPAAASPLEQNKAALPGEPKTVQKIKVTVQLVKWDDLGENIQEQLQQLHSVHSVSGPSGESVLTVGFLHGVSTGQLAHYGEKALARASVTVPSGGKGELSLRVASPSAPNSNGREHSASFSVTLTPALVKKDKLDLIEIAFEVALMDFDPAGKGKPTSQDFSGTVFLPLRDCAAALPFGEAETANRLHRSWSLTALVAAELVSQEEKSAAPTQPMPAAANVAPPAKE